MTKSPKDDSREEPAEEARPAAENQPRPGGQTDCPLDAAPAADAGDEKPGAAWEAPVQGPPDFPWTLLALLAFPAAALLAWSDSFSVPFLLDDGWNLSGNPGLTRLWPPWWAWLYSRGTGLAGRPVTAFTFALNHAVSGGAPWSYHLVNLAIHILAGLALFGLLRRALSFPRPEGALLTPGRASAAAFFCALAWLVHPLTIQAVTYITQRLESLAALFYLATLYAAARSLEPDASRKGRVLWRAASAGAFLLAAGSKETAVTAPFAVLLFDWTFAGGSLKRIFSRSAWLYLGFVPGLALLFLLVATGDTAGHAYAGNASFSALDYALFEPRVIWRYIRLAFIPAGLLFDYGQHYPGVPGLFASPLPVKLIFAAALAPLLILAARGAFLRRPAGLAGALFFLVLAPTSSVLPLFLVAEEHRMYLPLAALAALAGVGALKLAESRKIRASAMVGAALAVILVLGCLTYARNRDFKSAESIWSDTIQKAPGNPRAYASLAKIAADSGDAGRAITLYERAVSLYPDYAIARINLGQLLHAKGENKAAVDQYVAVLTRRWPFTKRSEKAMALSNLGNVFLDVGNYPKAKLFYLQALALEPDYAAARSNLGAALAAAGDAKKAIPELLRALELSPELVETRLNLAKALASIGRRGEAARYIEEAWRMAPENANVIDCAKSLHMETVR